VTAREGARLALLLPPIAVAFAMLVVAHDPPLSAAPFEYLFDALTGVVITLAGVVAMARRPGLRTGPALVVAGYWWYVGSLYTIVPSGTPIPLAGFVLRGYYDVILAFVILAFPGDRLETRRDRLAVGALLGAMVARSAWRLVAAQPGTGGIGPGPLAYPLHLVDSLDRFLDGEFALSAVVSLALLLVAGCALIRLGQSRPGARRIMVPVLAGGAVWAGGAALYGVAEFTHIRLGFDVVPWEGPGWAAQYALRALGPLGILVGMVRLRTGSSAAVALLSTPGGPPRGAELERALREALGDPALRLVYPAPDGGWAAATGAVSATRKARTMRMINPPPAGGFASTAPA